MRKSWTDEMVASELSTLVAGTGIMPSNGELRDLGRYDLANQIARRGGFIGWAERLGISRKISDSDKGWAGESALAEKLQSEGLSVERMRIKDPYDLKINGLVRVDVKSARYAEYGVCRGWFYRVGKNPQADIIALYQADTGVCYFLPWDKCPTTNVTIARNGGKYAKYKDRYDILKETIALRQKEAETIQAIL